MKYLNRFDSKKLLIALLYPLVLLSSCATWAIDIKVVNEDQKPLAHALVVVHLNKQRQLATDLVEIEQIDRQFNPQVRIIDSGQSVDFPNRDETQHHVYSFSKAKTFEIKLYKDTPIEPIQFSTPGIVALGCNIHDQMQGFIHVLSAYELGFYSNDQGMVDLDSQLNLADIQSLEVWHIKQRIPLSKRQKIAITSINSLNGQPLVVELAIRPVKLKQTNKTFGTSKF